MIHLNEISKSYATKTNGSVLALDDITLKLPDSGMIFLVGQSGSGKTTLMNCLAGFDSVDSGQIVIDDVDMSEFSKRQGNLWRNQYIGFLFYDNNLLDDLSVGENIGISSQVQGKDIDKAKILELLDSVGLKSYYTRRINELSAGQLQRVAICRSLYKDSKVILADEPTGNLDFKNTDLIFETLKNISKTKLVIIVTHDLNSADKWADRVVTLDKGRVISDGNGANSVDVNINVEVVATKRDILSQDDNVNNVKLELDDAKMGLPVGRVFSLGLRQLKKRPIRLVCSLLVPILIVAIWGICIAAIVYDVQKVELNYMYSRNVKLVKVANYDVREDGKWGYTTKSFTTKQSNSLSVFSKLEAVANNSIGIDLNGLNKYESDVTSALNWEQRTGIVANNEQDLLNNGYSKLYGEFPAEDNQIAITDFIFEYYKRNGIRGEKDENGQYGDTIIVETYQDVIDKAKPTNYKGEILEITAVYKTEYNVDELYFLSIEDKEPVDLRDTSALQIIFTNNSLEYLGSSVSTDTVYLYLKGNVKQDKAVYTYDYHFGDEVQSRMLTPQTESLRRAKDIQDSLKVYIFAIIVVLSLASALLITNYIVICIRDNTKKMGVLRSLGCGGRTIFGINLVSSLIIAAILSIGSIILFGIFAPLFDTMFVVTGLFVFSVPVVGLILLLSFVVTLIATIVPIVKISNTSIVKLLKLPA